MVYIAFTLGLFGSIHCIGMCGPLALTFGRRESGTIISNFISALSYNLGRTLTYIFMGLLMGVFGTLLLLTDIQQVVSIGIGILLIVSFAFSSPVLKKRFRIPFIDVYYAKIQKIIFKVMQSSGKYPVLILGMVNGLLPCGLVYLALIGALSSDDIINSAAFMGVFGLGTLPLMTLLIFGYNFLSPRVRMVMTKSTPYISLLLGVFMIYRGFAVEMPRGLSFLELLNRPILCH